MRRRLRLMEFDYEIVYRPGCVQQVPDALSRLTREDNDGREACIDEEISSFGDHLQVQRDQEAAVQILTRRQAAAAPSTGAAHAEPGARVGQQLNLNANRTVPDPKPLDLPPEK